MNNSEWLLPRGGKKIKQTFLIAFRLLWRGSVLFYNIVPLLKHDTETYLVWTKVCLMGRRYSVVDTVTGRAERPGVRNPAEAKRADQLLELSSLLSDWYRGYLSRVNWSVAKLATHLRLAPRLRISGAMSLVPLYTFVAWAGTALTFQCV